MSGIELRIARSAIQVKHEREENSVMSAEERSW